MVNSIRYLVSPTDSALCRELDGITSILPEQYGADVLAFLPGDIIAAWQRKTVTDLIDSLEDGRLARELPLLQKRTSFPVLLVEGEPVFNREDCLMRNGRPSRYSRKGYRNLLRSIRYQFGVSVEQTSSLSDTAIAIREMTSWLLKPNHSSLLRRPKPTDDWGSPISGGLLHEFILQGFPSVGPKTAQSLLRSFGRLPLRWDCTQAELRGVPGVGKIIAQGLWDTLNGDGGK